MSRAGWQTATFVGIFCRVTPNERLRVAFQGELGADAEDAIQMLFGAASIPVPCSSYADAVAAVSSRRADRAVLPIENTLIGSERLAHEAIDRAPTLSAVAETVVGVHHCLLGPPGAALETVATVLSHSIAIAQCQAFFRAHPRMQTHGVFDTAAAAREVAQLGDPSFAAVASHAAAGRFRLSVIVADIEDRHDNQTRFVALGPEPVHPDPGTPVRTMVVFTTRDAPGTLLLALQPFADHKVNLRRIDTHPTGEPWSYRFFVEFDHEVGNPHAESALAAAARKTAAMRVIGTFPRWNAGRRGSVGWTSADVPTSA
jgi:prephenate dehydratase